MKKVWALGIITVIFIVATVVLRISMDNTDTEYQEVKVTVVSSGTNRTTVKTGYSRSNITTYDITVNYMGKNYDLKNAHDSYSYREGSTVTAYLSNGRMYANIEGVQTSTPAATAYFVALIGSFVMFCIFTCTWANVAQSRRRERKSNQ